MSFKQSRTAFAVAAVLLASQTTLLASQPSWAAAASAIMRPPADDPVVARVDDTEIRRSDLILARKLLPAGYRKASMKAIYPFLLEQMINTALIVGAARAEGIDKIEAVRRRLEAIELRLVEGAYLEHAVNGKVTDRALRERYRAVTEPMRGKQELRVRHILLDNERAAVAVIRQLSDGADFATLAQRESIGPAQARGGDLGFLSREAMESAFADAAFGLTVGQVTPIPIETRFGWHVIELTDRRAAVIQSFEQMRRQLARQIRTRIAGEIVEKLRRNARVEEFDINGKPMPKSASR